MRIIRIPLFGILTASLMIIAVSSFAGIWEDDFNDGVADGWGEISGEWKVEGGAYQRTDMVPEYGKSIYGSGDWADYTIEADVTIIEGGPDSTSVAAGLLLRTDATGSSGYRFWTRDDTNGFQFSVWKDNTFKHVITDAAERAIPGQTYHLKVELEGFNISAWVDDRIMVDNHADADQLFESGLVGLINYNAHAQYDNITISSDTIAAVAPSKKLTTMWGSIKN